MKIHYISFYATDNIGRKMVCSSNSKIEYMISALEEIDEDMSIVSTALVEEGRGIQKTFKKNKVVYLSGVGLRGRIGKWLSLFVMQVMLWKYLVKNVLPEDVVIFYHSIAYCWPLHFAQRIKGFCTIMEFNDKYSYLIADKKKAKKIDRIERRMLKRASAYIFASELMKEVTEESKPFVVNYGSYAPASKQSIKTIKATGEIVNLLYSGILEPLRRAGELAIDAMRYLPDSYVLHIAGFGDAKYLSQINQMIAEVNAEKKKEVIVYHGFMNGGELEELMQKCDIALSTHAYEFEWQSRLSFPSKIPLNMANDLYIVAGNLPVIVNSPFAAGCCFYEEHDPEAIAQAIIRCVSVHMTRETIKPSRIISKLDKEFREELKEMVIEKVKKKER